MRFAAAIIVLWASAARADPPAEPYEPHPSGGIGVAIGGGAAWQPGSPDAWMARLDYEMFMVLPRRHELGPLFGLTGGFEYWRGAPDWGCSLPVRVVAGIRAFPFRAMVGFGVAGFLVDRVKDDTGFGLWAPLASASAGIDVGGLTVTVDTRVTRRWQFGADDHTQWTVALMVGGILDMPARKPTVMTRAR